MVTPTQWIQIIAALTLPLGLIVITISRMGKGKKLLKRFRWKDMMMAILWMVIPTLLIFGLQGILRPLVVAGGIALVILVVLLRGNNRD